MPNRTTLPSYSTVFRPERRIHQIDGHRLPVPGGVPLAVVGYAALGLIAVIVPGQLPPIGALLELLHPALRYLGLPVAAAVVLWRVRPDARSAPAAVFSWLRWRASRRTRGPAAERLRVGLRHDRRGRQTGRYRSRDGLQLAVEEEGRGEPEGGAPAERALLEQTESDRSGPNIRDRSDRGPWAVSCPEANARSRS